MSRFLRLSLLPGFVALDMIAGAGLCAAEEPTGDLLPIPPMTRSLSPTNNPYLFRNFSNGNTSPSISADGKLLLMTNGNGLVLWKLDERIQGQPRNLDTNNNLINYWNASTALSPDGKVAAVVPQNYGSDMAVRFFDTATGKQVREIDNDQPIFGLALSPDGRLLAAATQQRIELWKADNGEEVRVFSSGQNANNRLLTFSPDGKMLAALGNEPDTIHIWEVASGKERAAVHFGTQPAPVAAGRRARIRVVPGNNNNNILALEFSADCRLLAVSKQDSAIHLWDLQNDQELMPLTGAPGQVRAMVFSPDGKELIGVDTEGMRLSWRMAALRRNLNIRLSPLDDAEFTELWNDLAEVDNFRIYRARRRLTADPKRAVPLLTRHLEPVPAGDQDRIQQLIKDLSNANAGKRRQAMTELRTKHGEAALGALTQMTGGNAAMGGGGMGGRVVMMGGPGGNSQAAMVLAQKLQMQYNTPERQRDVLAVHILEEIGTTEARQTLAKLAKGAPGVELTTASQAALDHLAAAVKERPRQTTLEQLWIELGNDDAMRAFKAMCGLAAAPEQAAAVLRKELKPAPVIEDKEIAVLVGNLGSDDFKVREQATESLGKIGELALPAMKKALGGDIALEARKRLERLVEQASAPAPAPLLRGLRAIEVLEHAGTAESKDVLLALAGGAPQAHITREAKASLQRLTRR